MSEASFRKIPTTSARRFTSFDYPLDRVGAVMVAAALAGEGHVGQNIVLAVVHQINELG